MLTARAARPHVVDPHVGFAHLKIDALRLLHHENGRRRRVDPSLRLCRRYPLDAMCAILAAQGSVGAVARDERRRFSAPSHLKV